MALLLWLCTQYWLSLGNESPFGRDVDVTLPMRAWQLDMRLYSLGLAASTRGCKPGAGDWHSVNWRWLRLTGCR